MSSISGQQKSNSEFTRGGGTTDEYPWRWHIAEECRRELVLKERDPAAVADDWGCSERTIYRALREHGLLEEFRDERGMAA